MKRNTHTKVCQCEGCVKRKVSDYLARIHDTSRLVPETLDQTVAVRAHWRRHPGHLKKMPKLREALREALKDQMAVVKSRKST